MTEWFKVLVLKTIVFHDTVGSNPTLSLIFLNFFFDVNSNQIFLIKKSCSIDTALGGKK